MEQETTGTVVAVSRQWWLKVNRKPVRAHALDGASFPHIITVRYPVEGADYTCRKWLGADRPVPDVGRTVKVFYRTDRPSKARAAL